MSEQDIAKISENADDKYVAILKKLTLEEQQLIVEIASGILKLNHPK